LWLIPFPSLAQISFLGHRQHAILVGGNNRLKPALRLMSDYRLVIEEIKEAKATTSYTRWVDAVQARGEFAASLAFASIHPKQIQGRGRIL
jgi:hypothetical protein